MNLFSLKKRTPRARVALGCATALSVLGVGYIIRAIGGDEPVDARPILPTLLATHSTEPFPASAAPPAHTQAAPLGSPPAQPSPPPAVLAALSLPGDRQEDTLINAIREWATKDPERAFVFAKSLHTSARGPVIQTVLETLGTHPDLALRAGRQMILEEPDQVDVLGSILISALTSAKEFTTALEFAQSPGAEGSQTDWTAAIIGQWVRSQPEMVPQLAAIVARPGTPELVIQAFREAWASAAPASAAEYALSLPAGETRQAVVARAVSEWINREPKAAAEWIDQKLKNGPEYDQALAALLTQTPREFYSPQTALDRTATISDPLLRTDTRVTLIRSWAEMDRQAALNYLQLARGVSPAERGQLFATLTQPPAPLDTSEPHRFR